MTLTIFILLFFVLMLNIVFLLKSAYNFSGTNKGVNSFVSSVNFFTVSCTRSSLLSHTLGVTSRQCPIKTKAPTFDWQIARL